MSSNTEIPIWDANLVDNYRTITRDLVRSGTENCFPDFSFEHGGSKLEELV